MIELLTKGSAADGSRASTSSPLGELRSTHDVCTELYEWATVTPLRPGTPLAEVSRG